MSTSAKEQGVVRFSIKVDGSEIKFIDSIISIKIIKAINKIARATIVLCDGDIAKQSFEICDKNIFEIGSSINIEVGYGKELNPIFKGVITKLTIQSGAGGGSTITVSCQDVAYRMTLTPKTKVFLKSKDSDAIRKITSEYSGLQASVETTNIQHESLLQHAITDWDFINIRAEANGKIIIVDGGKFGVKQPDIKSSPVLSVTYGVDILDFETSIDTRDQWKGAVGQTWNMSQQRTEKITAKEPGECSLGDIKYDKLVSVNKQEAVSINHGGMLAQDEMKTLLTSLLQRSRASKIKGKVTISGNAAIQVDKVIEINTGTKHFKGEAYVSGVQHTIAHGIWATALSLGMPSQRYMLQYKDITSLPAAGMLSPVHGLQVGIVKQLDQDPLSGYRILVSLPMIHTNQDGIWCRIASLYASNKVGIFFMPEIDDEVVVGFINDDIRCPIVVGSLHNGVHAMPVVLDKNNDIKTIISREKLEITFNDQKDGPEIILKTPKGRVLHISDKKKGVEIINAGANKVILGEKNVEIHSGQDIIFNAQGSITLKAMQNLTLEGSQNINLKGMNVAVKASMKAELAGDLSTEVKSSGMTTVKGTTVMIN